MANAKDGEYEVGFGKPPRNTQFQKGKSGNPKGRPRGSKNFSTVFEEELQQRVIVREKGKQKAITKLRACIKQLVNKAASGDPRAIKALVDINSNEEKRSATARAETQRLDEFDEEVLQGILDRLKQQPEEDEGGKDENKQAQD
jgi:hypothetical protein